MIPASGQTFVPFIVGDGTWNQPPGTLTDDTAQALCIARSLVEQGTFDPADVAERFPKWYDSGPFDIGTMTRRSLEKLQQGSSWDEAGQQVWEESAEGSNAGNGSVMRCPPLAVAYADDPVALAAVSRHSSLITHADPRCTYGCAVLNLTIAALLQDEQRPLSRVLEHVGMTHPTNSSTHSTRLPMARTSSRSRLRDTSLTHSRRHSTTGFAPRRPKRNRHGRQSRWRRGHHRRDSWRSRRGPLRCWRAPRAVALDCREAARAEPTRYDPGRPLRAAGGRR